MARKKRRTSLGVLFWIAFILFVIVVFMVNRPRIQTVLDNTGLVEIITERVGGDPAERDRLEDQVDGGPELVFPDDHDSGPDGSADPSEDPVEPRESPEERTQPPAQPEETDDERSEETGQPPEETATPDEREEPGEPARRVRNGRLYYVRVTDDGAFAEGVNRSIEYTDSPLTETVRTLIAGPTANEVSNGLLNLIPEGTELLRATVRNGVAYLDFNEAFRFNPMGVEGYRMQLKQIIYATTEFNTVDRVQFLVDGEQHEWLGGEGVYIGSPLGRDSFS